MENELIKISTTEDGHYKVAINQGTSVEEVLFAMTVVLKCFDRDGVIEKENAMKLIEKYLNDVQYEEVQS